MSMLDEMATAGLEMLAEVGETELLTYYSKSSATATPVVYAGLTGWLEQFQIRELGLAMGGNEVILTDRRARFATSAVLWTPTPWDELTQADGRRWRVMSALEGTRRVWTLLHVRAWPAAT